MPPPPSSSSGYSPDASSSPAPEREYSPTPSDVDKHSADVDAALDFLEQLLQPESIRRITPRTALYHPFLRDPDGLEDDDFVPHPFLSGSCADLHFMDEVGEFYVRVRVDADSDGDGDGEGGRAGDDEWVVRKVRAGEGLAIGRTPCEFHRDVPL